MKKLVICLVMLGMMLFTACGDDNSKKSHHTEDEWDRRTTTWEEATITEHILTENILYEKTA